MYYNILKENVNTEIDCFSCPFHNHNTNVCNGFGKCCLPMDDMTNVVLDPLTDKALTEVALNNLKDNLEKELQE